MSTKEYAQFTEGDRTIVVKRSANPVEARVIIEGLGYLELGVPAARELRHALMAFLDDCWENPPVLSLTPEQERCLRLLARHETVRYDWWTEEWSVPDPPVIVRANNKRHHTLRELAELSLATQINGLPFYEVWVLTEWGKRAVEKADA